jgi:hypothetical protein
MKHVAATALAVLLLTVLLGHHARAGERLDPKRTHALIVGVLEFKGNAMSGWSKEARKDQELYDTLLAMGVPAKNMTLLLDREATKEAVEKATRDVAARARKGDLLLFYYAGHGFKDGAGNPFLAAWDSQPREPAATGIAIDTIAASLGKLRGIDLLLLADCCYSGELKRVAEAASKNGSRAAAITSAAASNTSTNTWAYSMALLDCLRGRPLADRNGDRRIDLGELAAEVTDNMKFREHQRAGTVLAGLPETWTLAETSGEPPFIGKAVEPFQYGEFVTVSVDGEARTVRRLERSGDGYEVELWGYCDRHRVDVTKARVKRLEFKRYAKGESLDVLWGGQAYEATVLEVDGDFHRVTYPGWPPFWDEWVMSDRIVGIHRKPADAPTEGGDGRAQVMVEWGGDWWPATVIDERATKGGREYRIHYTGYDASWDEWVTPQRIRFPDKEGTK